MSAPARAIAVRDAYAYCQRLTKREARNFYFAFLTLPARKRRAIYAAYSFCRQADDIADGEGEASAKRRELAALRDRLHEALDGKPDGPVLTALADATKAFGVPARLYDDVIDGVEMDIEPRRYETFADLRVYCYRVASAVGLMSAEIFGYTDRRALQAAEDLGLAMQITNILRDLREDAERGRVYLPLEDLRRFGYAEDDLRRGVMNDAFRALMQFEALRARDYFSAGAGLLPMVSYRARSCPAALHGLYSRLLDRIEQRDYDVFSERVRLSTAEKLGIMAKAWLRSMIP